MASQAKQTFRLSYPADVVLQVVTDPAFLEEARSGHVRLVMLTLPNSEESISIVENLKTKGYEGLIAATARFSDEMEAFEKAGVHAVFDVYAEAGAGFTQHMHEIMKEPASSQVQPEC